MLPMVVFFPGCSCNSDQAPTQSRTDLTYTVRFYTDSLQTFNISNQTVKEGQLVRRPIDPIKTGYRFVGWYLDSELTQVWTFEIDTVSQDMTLYARWQIRE